MLVLRIMNENEICRLYEQSLSRDFPSNELKSLSTILNMVRRGIYDVFGAYEGNELAGYALLYCPRENRVALLDYFAVEPLYRGQGIGTNLLRKLCMHYASNTDVLMVECERPQAAPDEAEARKRIRFYTHAGAKLTSVRIWLFDVEYSILVLPCAQTIPRHDWAAMMMHLYKQMLPDELFKENVRLIQA